MYYIDTHAHLSDEQFINDIDETIERCKNGGVKHILVPDVGIDGREALNSLCDRYSGYLRPMVGVHPNTIDEVDDWESEIFEVEKELTSSPKGRFCAVGEIGLDYYWCQDFKDEQRRAFIAQCELAIKFDLPVNIHTRDAWGDMCDILESFKGRSLRGVMHAFCDTYESYDRISRCGDFLFSIGGVVTFKRSQVADVVPHIPLEKMLLETDSPYLTPAPHRGKRNDPSHLSLICEKIASLKNSSPEMVARATNLNAERMFRL